MIHLARSGSGPVKADEIGQAMDVPTGFLRQILQSLDRAGFLTSTPGPNGGYALVVDPARVTVRQVIEALEGSITGGECALRGGPCRWDDVCALHWAWSSAREAFASALDQATIAAVAAQDAALESGKQDIPTDTHRGGGSS